MYLEDSFGKRSEMSHFSPILKSYNNLNIKQKNKLFISNICKINVKLRKVVFLILFIQIKKKTLRTSITISLSLYIYIYIPDSFESKQN